MRTNTSIATLPSGEEKLATFPRIPRLGGEKLWHQ